MGDEIIKVLNHLGDKFGIAIDWSSTNVLPYLQDLMNRIAKYEIYTSIAYILLFVIVSIILYLTVKFVKQEDIAALAPIALCIWLAISGIGIFVEVMDIIEVTTIPEKYVIDMIKYETQE